MNRSRLRACVTALTLFLCACGGAAAPETAAEGAPFAREAEVTFPVAPSVPLALVDLNGYETGGEKTVLFRTREVGDTFEIRSALDDSVVYTGAVRALAADEEMAYGRFTDFQTGGSYYIFNEEIGTSYAFRIGADIHAELLSGSLLQFYYARCGTEVSGSAAGTSAHAACHLTNARLQQEPSVEAEVFGGWHTDAAGNRDTIAVCDTLRDLLLAYELTPERFRDDSGIPESGNDVPDVLDEARLIVAWLMRMQDAQGAFYSGVSTGGNDISANLTLREQTPEATIRAAEVMARFAYVYGSFDDIYAEEVLRQAEQAWESYTAVRTPLQERAAFAAAAELYRITGERKYEMVLAGFFPREDYAELLAEDDEIFYGSATYLQTLQPVNPEVCNAIRAHMTAAVQEIKERIDASAYLVSAEDSALLLKDMLRLCVTNHFIYRPERREMAQDAVHFLCGRNPEAVDVVTWSSENHWKKAGCAGLYESLPDTARWVLLLASL
ncbi:MAG: glycoside hydrolase family 9 protein [Lachnospiraceae bacterium]|nr:glycoside hydrolase family 9 protein [Lachnospiraceae bacterium]